MLERNRGRPQEFSYPQPSIEGVTIRIGEDRGAPVPLGRENARRIEKAVENVNRVRDKGKKKAL